MKTPELIARIRENANLTLAMPTGRDQRGIAQELARDAQELARRTEMAIKTLRELRGEG